MLSPLAKLPRRVLARSRMIGDRDRQLARRIHENSLNLRDAEESALRSAVECLRGEVAAGCPLTAPEIMVPAFGLVREAARRVLGIELYDVQLLAGIVLARNSIAEMQTGEGKTVVAALPASLHALRGEGVHVMTVNSYLAERDFAELEPLYEFLGLRAGLLDPGASLNDKRDAYRRDITYGPGYEFGFDYLRDELTARQQDKPRLGESVYQRLCGTARETSAPRLQRSHAFAVVDEADSVMIDEATTPMLLARTGRGDDNLRKLHVAARRAALALAAGRDFLADRGRRAVSLTDQGMTRIADSGQQAAAWRLERPWARYVEQALFAEQFLRRDIDYTLSGEEVHIVDKDTGRIFTDRSWRDGLHQAVQAKEGVTVTAEQRPLASMTRQRFFRLYSGLCGMTGTTLGSEREFRVVYQLPVVRIPTNRPCRRREYATRYFADGASRWIAVVDEIRELHKLGRPILVGTRTIEDSLELATQLELNRLAFQMLNGKQDAREADVVGRAGRRGMITIATNMAGRGTDIKLGRGVDELGGLHVIACERHESRRVDRQLAGRAARQGDAGSVSFYVSAADELIERHGRRMGGRLRRAAGEDGEAMVNLTRQIAAAQRRAERERYQNRKQLFSADDWREDVLARFEGRTAENDA